MLERSKSRRKEFQADIKRVGKKFEDDTGCVRKEVRVDTKHVSKKLHAEIERVRKKLQAEAERVRKECQTKIERVRDKAFAKFTDWSVSRSVIAAERGGALATVQPTVFPPGPGLPSTSAADRYADSPV